ncbi:anti-CBASS protein Acb1 family protein, partial [Borrelia persica]|uniref:anti-CBASS protein Acb1 family protein n=1 Tax=Borrelia persica TaxID=44448 RepID=UPI0004635832
ELDNLKIELKSALLQCIISYRFNGVGYILVKTADELNNLNVEVNQELPTGFMYLDYDRVYDTGIDSSYITYYCRKGNKEEAIHGLEQIKIHKSRLIIYENYDYILHSYTPCYTESFLLDVYLLEKIYEEIGKRIETHNFLFYKDDSLADLQDVLSSAVTSVKENKRGGLSNFLNFFSFTEEDNSNESGLGELNGKLRHELEQLKYNLNNDGLFYSSSTTSSLEVIKYDMTYLKEALSLIKAKIGADAKEPLTRSFNEQVKGLGSDGKGDRSNYYDF